MNLHDSQLRSRRFRGFTLLELILTMIIACTLLALAAPSMTGWGRGAKLQNTADSVLSMTRLARTRAITSAAIQRLVVGGDGSVKLTQQDLATGGFVDVNDMLGRPLTLPDGCKIELNKPAASASGGAPGGASTGGAAIGNSAGLNGNSSLNSGGAPQVDPGGANTVDFYPSGRVEPATIRLSDAHGAYTIQSLSPAEDFQIVPSQGAQ